MEPRPHEKSTQLFADIAEKFSVDVEASDYDKWSAALTMAKALDTIVDDDHIYDSGVYSQRVLQGESIPYLTEHESEFIRGTYEQLNEASQEQWRPSANLLGEFAIKRMQAETIHAYLRVVREEAPLTAGVLLVENDGHLSDSAAREHFNIWLGEAMQSFYIFDTCSDFIKDHNEGNMNVPINLTAIRELSKAASVEVIKMARITPVAAYPAFARRSAAKIREKISRTGFWSNQFVIKGAR